MKYDKAPELRGYFMLGNWNSRRAPHSSSTGPPRLHFERLIWDVPQHEGGMSQHIIAETHFLKNQCYPVTAYPKRIRHRWFEDGNIDKGVENLVKISELRLRDVINTYDGKRLGTIKDIDFDLEQGKIKSLILPGNNGSFFSLFARSDEVVVPWENIMKIGVDVILVSVGPVIQPNKTEKMEK